MANSIIQMNTGSEKIAGYELRVSDYYVNYSKCPFQYKSVNRSSERFGGFAKLKHCGKNGEVITRTGGSNSPYYLDVRNSSQSYRERMSAAWYHNIYEVPNNTVIKIDIHEHRFGMGGQVNFGVLFFRARDTGPMLRVEFIKAHGLQFIIEGRMDLLPPDYIAKNNMLSHASEMKKIDPILLKNFVSIKTIMPAIVDLNSTEQESIVLGSNKVEIPKRKNLRKVFS